MGRFAFFPNRPAVCRGAIVTSVVGFCLAAAAPGCLDRPIEPVEPRTTSTIVERLKQSSVDKIDLLFVIDNSRSMADKQQILESAIPDLVDQLINPRCFTKDGVLAAQQPDSPTKDCPVDDTAREFKPVLNIHIGVITSSLGGHGGEYCSTSPALASSFSETWDDEAHLIDRQKGSTDKVPTYNDGTEDKSFLVWDPSEQATHSPQGETNLATLTANLKSIVVGAGEVGCGFEAPLEAWYRFLVEPHPHDSSAVVPATGIVLDDLPDDDVVLKQRADFLRPDSLLAIIMLTDENDCSIIDAGSAYFATLIGNLIPLPRKVCATDPNSPCCKSCAEPPGEGCEEEADHCSSTGVVKEDGSCDNNPGSPAFCNRVQKDDDHQDLRCYDQKRRFGIDFLHPIDRYVTGLTNPQVADRFGELVLNPIYTDLQPEDDNNEVRDDSLVFIAGIVGVPWHDIARRNANGQPDLLNGCVGACQDDDGDGKPDNDVGGFQGAEELADNKTWDLILGDPGCANNVNCKPQDPLMHEQPDPRSGTHPLTGDVIGLPPASNAINGNEYKMGAVKNDLQYACIFPLAAPRICDPADDTPEGKSRCLDCFSADDTNPLCADSDDDLMNGNDHLKQIKAKAYPGLRLLELLKRVGPQAIVGSICPKQQDNDEAADFGYRPAIGSIVERLKLVLGGQCLPRSLKPDAAGQVACLILEGRPAGCDCTAPARLPVHPDHKVAEKLARETMGIDGACFCEIEQTRDIDLDACQTVVQEPVTNKDNQAVDGWCYIDATTVPATGNRELVKNCPATQKRIIRFVGEAQGATGATLFITCSGE